MNPDIKTADIYGLIKTMNEHKVLIFQDYIHKTYFKSLSIQVKDDRFYIPTLAPIVLDNANSNGFVDLGNNKVPHIKTIKTNTSGQNKNKKNTNTNPKPNTKPNTKTNTKTNNTKNKTKSVTKSVTKSSNNSFESVKYLIINVKTRSNHHTLKFLHQ